MREATPHFGIPQQVFGTTQFLFLVFPCYFKAIVLIPNANVFITSQHISTINVLCIETRLSNLGYRVSYVVRNEVA